MYILYSKVPSSLLFHDILFLSFSTTLIVAFKCVKSVPIDVDEDNGGGGGGGGGVFFCSTK